MFIIYSMFQFDYNKLYNNFVPTNIPNKMISYSVGGVPVVTYVLIGFTTAMLAAVTYLDEGSGSSSSSSSEPKSEPEPEPEPESEPDSDEEEEQGEDDEEEEGEDEEDDGINNGLFNRGGSGSNGGSGTGSNKKEGKQYTPVDKYKPTGKFVYNPDVLEKIDERLGR